MYWLAGSRVLSDLHAFPTILWMAIGLYWCPPVGATVRHLVENGAGTDRADSLFAGLVTRHVPMSTLRLRSTLVGEVFLPTDLPRAMMGLAAGSVGFEYVCAVAHRQEGAGRDDMKDS